MQIESQITALKAELYDLGKERSQLAALLDRVGNLLGVHSPEQLFTRLNELLALETPSNVEEPSFEEVIN